MYRGGQLRDISKVSEVGVIIIQQFRHLGPFAHPLSSSPSVDHEHINVMIISIDFLQEIFAIDILTALKSSLKHRCKRILQLLRPSGDQALKNSSLRMLECEQTNTLGITLEISNNYPWTRLAVRLI